MGTKLILSLLGPDRAGLVQALSQLVADHNGNWLESRMIRLGGCFSGIVRIELTETSSQEDFRAALNSFDPDFQILIQSETPAPEKQGTFVELSIQGQDRKGIVQEVTALLGKLNINIEELHSEAVAAAWSGEQLFLADALLQLPQELNLAQVQEKIETLSDDLIVDLEPTELDE